MDSQTNTPTSKNQEMSISQDRDSNSKPFSPRKSSFHPKIFPENSIIKLQPLDKPENSLGNYKNTSNTSENEGFSDSPNNLNNSEDPELLNKRPNNKIKRTLEKSNIYKNVLKKGFAIDNFSPDHNFKVCTDAVSNMTLSVASLASSEHSATEDGTSSIKKVETSKVSKFQRYSKTSDPWENEEKLNSDNKKSNGRLSERKEPKINGAFKKPTDIRRVIFHREKDTKKKLEFMKKKNMEKRRNSVQDKCKENNDSKERIHDFDHMKKFSKKERETFQNHIQYMKYVRKITELKSISRLFAFIISSSRLIGRTELLTKSNPF